MIQLKPVYAGEPVDTVEARGYSAWELDGENNAMDFGRLLAAR